MKSNDKEPGKNPDNNKAANTANKHSNDYNNEISTGSIGLEGSAYNGAPELRSLRKKYGAANDKK